MVSNKKMTVIREAEPVMLPSEEKWKNTLLLYNTLNVFFNL